MSNFAELKLVADPTGLEKGVKVIKEVTKEGGKAQKSTDKLGKEFVQTGNQAATASPKIKTVALASNATAVAAKRAAVGLGLMIASYASFQAISSASSSALSFNAALRETSTLIEGTPEQMEALSSGAIALAADFGGSATDQVKAFYQAISSGSSTVAEAQAILQQANKLAIGGVTDVTTAVDGLTTAVNVYASEGLTAAEASDSLFVAMKAGKTTIGELSSSLGVILPISQAVGVSFDETAAGVAALTKGGLSTSVAVTALRSTLAQIIKPTKQASDAAAELGIDFSASALASKGLGQFMEELIVVTGGSKTELTKLFGSIESLPAVFGFAGEAGKSYAQIMEDMGNKTGETEAAFLKISEGLDQRFKVVLGKTMNATIILGNALIKVLVPAAEAVAVAVSLIADNGDVLIAVLIGLTATQVPAMILAFGSLKTILTGAAVAARGLGVAMSLAGGPIGILVGLLSGAVTYFVLFKDAAGDVAEPVDASALALEALNTQMATFATTFAPKAGREAINLANNYVTLATSIHNAALEQVAMMEVQLAGRQAMTAGLRGNGRLAGADIFGEQEAAEIAADLSIALAEVQLAEAALEKARRKRISAVKLVMNSEADMQNALEEQNATINITVDGIKSLGSASGTTAGKVDELSDALKDAEQKSANVNQMFGSTFSGIIRGADSAGDAIRNLVSRFADMALTNLFTNVFSNIGAGGFVSQLLGLADGGIISGGRQLAFANGGVIRNQSVTPFAGGGVVSDPTIFPMARGAGLMGEAGPEAIMPLSRGPNGKLGVQSTGDQASMHVTVSVEDDGKLIAIIQNESGKVIAQSIPVIRDLNRRDTGQNNQNYDARFR